jgi:hypothetical protein
MVVGHFNLDNDNFILYSFALYSIYIHQIPSFSVLFAERASKYGPLIMSLDWAPSNISKLSLYLLDALMSTDIHIVILDQHCPLLFPEAYIIGQFLHLNRSPSLSRFVVDFPSAILYRWRVEFLSKLILFV